MSSIASIVKKQDEDDKPPKPEAKPVVKTLNRVPRACNACRKQKMRCEGADNPPCRRCRNTGLECLFEKPSREATLTGEAGLERFRALEAHVADIRLTQATMSKTLEEVLMHLRNPGIPIRSPAAYPQVVHQHSPPNINSPSISTPASSHQHIEVHQSPSTATSTYLGQHTPIANASTSAPSRPHRSTLTNPGYHHTSLPQPNPPVYGQYQAYNINKPTSTQGLPIGVAQSQGASSSLLDPLRYGLVSDSRLQSPLGRPQLAGSKRHLTPSVPSPESSGDEDEDHGGLPSAGLVAPWESLRGLVEVVIDPIKDGDSSAPHSRARTPSPDRQRSAKRRKVNHPLPAEEDVITKNIISEEHAQLLFKIFYEGCSTFLPVFAETVDTLGSLRERSPFAVNCICMVAARVQDGGGKPSQAYLACLEEVKRVSSKSLFLPVLSYESVQAMVLVAGWSDNGWLSGGHAVRMAMELSMHKAWPKLKRRILNRRMSDDDHDLVVASRVWFCLYLFEHQLSYGTGRPAIMKVDESIIDCRFLLDHPLAVPDDMRLVSTVELITIRERTHNELAPFDKSVTDHDIDVLRHAEKDFEQWYTNWDHVFSQKYEDAAFYRQSLQIQYLHAALFHNATALRGVNGPSDVEKMPPGQRELALQSIQIAQRVVNITINSTSYRTGMRYAVHYTHATATFAGSLLLRLARLFPSTCDADGIRRQVDSLANLMAQIPGQRYALTLRLMLRRWKKRTSKSTSRSPRAPKEQIRSIPMTVDQNTVHNGPDALAVPPQYNQEIYAYDPSYAVPSQIHNAPLPTVAIPHGMHPPGPDFWRGLEGPDVPVWVSDQNPGAQLLQNGMDAFVMPSDYVSALPNPQAWV